MAAVVLAGTAALFPTPLQAQSCASIAASTDSVALDMAFQGMMLALRARNTNDQALYRSAHSCLHQAFAQFRRSRNVEGEKALISALAEAETRIGMLDSALVHYRRALQFIASLPDRDPGPTLIRLGDVFATQQVNDSAKAYYWRGFAAADTRRIDEGRAIALDRLGEVYSRTGQSDSALAMWERADSALRKTGSYERLASVLMNIGRLHFEARRLAAAEESYAAALALSPQLQTPGWEVVPLAMGLAPVAEELGQPDRALRYLDEAIAVAARTADPGVRAYLLRRKTKLLAMLGHTGPALETAREALRIASAAGDTAGIAQAMNDIGTQYDVLGQERAALDTLRRAQALFSALHDPGGEALALHNMGSAFIGLQRPDSAEVFYRRALVERRQANDIPGEAMTLNSLGSALLSQGKTDSAAAYFRRAIELHRRVRDRSGEATAAGNLAVVEGDQGNASGALTGFREMLQAKRFSGERGDEWMALLNIAHVYATRRDFRRALAYYDSAAAIRASLRREAGGESNRVSFAEQSRLLFVDWLYTVARQDPGADPRAIALGTLGVVERFRAQALLDLVRDRSGPGFVLARDAGADTVPGSNIVELAARLVRPLQTRGITALSYFVTRDALMIWVILPNGQIHFLADTEGRPARLDTLVAAMHVRFGNRFARGATGGESVRHLFVGPDSALASSPHVLELAELDPDSLLAQIANIVLPLRLRDVLPPGGELVVVPHGIVSLIPFAALPAGPGGERLGYSHPLRYAPSFAVLNAVENTASVLGTAADARATLGRSIVLGDPSMPTNPLDPTGQRPLPPLFSARSEADSISTILGAPVLVGHDATELRVRALLPTAPVVHLATHGFAYSSDELARSSWVALAPAGAPPQPRDADGLLTVAEIMDDPGIRLQAELVVLSACQSGLGNLKEAEGTVGLQRALLARGARSVLVSLWDVDDEATSVLMRAFYRHWLGGQGGTTKSEALRSAQRELATRYRSPYYWAAFQLVGAN